SALRNTSFLSSFFFFYFVTQAFAVIAKVVFARVPPSTRFFFLFIVYPSIRFQVNYMPFEHDVTQAFLHNFSFFGMSVIFLFIFLKTTGEAE
ncbi:hypothetical protein, partial [Leptospira borgpetersenii]|uniref:hypothetical protein n=1 Tax=Leptospira borgpetersenii TaxID=174 RepID=UPI0027DC05AE